MKRWIDAVGYGKFFGAACEAIVRIPNRPEPPSKFADAVWQSDLPKSLVGKTFAITGSSRGLGFVLAKRIAQRGGNLILLNRKSAHSDKARDAIQKLATDSQRTTGGKAPFATQIDCDLCDFASVRKVAAEVRQEVERKSASLDCLVLNAGLMAQSDIRTKDGYDIQMQANHLSHFLLTSLLMDLLHAAAAKHGEARVVSHSSGARHSPDEAIREESLEKQWAEGSKAAGDANTMSKWVRYQQSKRANLAFTYALADVLAQKAGNKVKALCAHPGATNSGLQSHTDAASYMDRLINGLAVVAGQSTEDGCLGLAVATVKEGVANGDFFGPKGITGDGVLLPAEREKGAHPTLPEGGAGYDTAQLRMLWEKSVAATGASWGGAKL